MRSWQLRRSTVNTQIELIWVQFDLNMSMSCYVIYFRQFPDSPRKRRVVELDLWIGPGPPGFSPFGQTFGLNFGDDGCFPVSSAPLSLTPLVSSHVESRFVRTVSATPCITDLRFKQHLSNWLQLPLLPFPMLPNMAYDPSQTSCDIVFQTSDIHTLQCVLCSVSQAENGRSRRPAAVQQVLQ